MAPKSRSGVPEKQAFGPGQPDDTKWCIWPRRVPVEAVAGMLKGQAYTVESSGPTAFIACARVGLALSEVVDIKPKTD